MLKIKDIVKSPSSALQAMVDGLRSQNERHDFHVDMCTFGEYDEDMDICFGCAATCAVQEIFGKNLRGHDIVNIFDRADIFGCDIKDIDSFESAINYARLGNMSLLFEYYGYYGPEFLVTLPHLILYTGNWLINLPLVEEYIKELIERGY
jgi:hypothetical protein